MSHLLVYLQLMELAVLPVVQLQLLLHCHTHPQAVLSTAALLDGGTEGEEVTREAFKQKQKKL